MSSHGANSDFINNVGQLSKILKSAAMDNNTVIITSLNEAWAEPQSMFDCLLESFRIGNQTERFLKHLVVVAVDQKAYDRCLKLHPHCYHLVTDGSDFSEEAYFMTPDYLKLVWRKIDFLGKVLNLGYNFVFTVRTHASITVLYPPFLLFHICCHFSLNIVISLSTKERNLVIMDCGGC
ncbi:hypothetical protein QVD17_26958 [Tagetes erecta]|uniref:Nucleotide-diphospho-sugar transferase domain-containing protein n=1 Tax=Tagetes erecta TaxID=13708 RepID=A0AAD8K8A9_TARER|nr:hypothetical protein QVD17_26958 [Tagetes erecta]